MLLYGFLHRSRGVLCVLTALNFKFCAARAKLKTV